MNSEGAPFEPAEEPARVRNMAASQELARSVPASQKVKAVLRVLEGAQAEEVARELGVSSEGLLRWKQEFIDGGRSQLMRRKDRGPGRPLWLRRQWLPWGSLVLGLVIVIWVVTRFFAGAPGGE